MRAILNNLKQNWITYGFETLVVIMGILIAFGLNSWNDSRQARSEENKYLQRLKDDLQTDSSYLTKRIEFSQKEQQSYYDFMHQMLRTQESLEHFIALTSSVVWNSDNLILQDRTYQEITTSGRFNLIQDRDLKDELMDYYKSYSHAERHITEMNNTSIQMYLPFSAIFTKYYVSMQNLYDDPKMQSEKDWEFINQPDSEKFRVLQGVAGFYQYKQRVFEGYYSELLVKCEMLLKMVDQKID